MTTSRRHSIRPVVVEVKPDNATVPSILSPSTPPTPSSPKAVRFSATPDRASRPLTSTEAWSLYHFENHARQCSQCYKPHEVYRRGDRLCDAGHGLSQDVAEHVFRKDGDIYSTKRDNSKLVRVEIPHGYAQLGSLLKALERGIRSHRTVPIISYDRSYPISARRSYEPEGARETVIIQPANSTDYQSRRRSRQTPTPGYPAVVINDDRYDDNDTVESNASLRLPKSLPKERRGSLYEKDMQRKERNYRVEIREPSDRNDRRRDSGYRESTVWL